MAGNRLARMGRYGDTEIRNVSGRQSHVNRREAGLIDLYGMLGESLVKREGAGTINPLSGLPEYHIEEYWPGFDKMNKHNRTHARGEEPASHKAEKAKRSGEAFGEKALEGFDRNQYMSAMQSDVNTGTDANVTAYLMNLGLPKEDVKYFQTNLNQDYLGSGGFIQKKFERGIGAAGTQYGRSLYDVREQSEAITAKTDVVFSGEQKFREERVQKGLFADYTTQVGDLAFAQETAYSDIAQQGQEEFFTNLEDFTGSL